MRMLFLILLPIILAACANTLELTAQTENAPNTFSVFGDCALPCVLGITPGQTEYSKALEMITTLPQVRLSDIGGDYWIEGRNNNRIYLRIRRVLPNKDNTVSTVELSTYSSEPIVTIGELINSGLIPIKVFRNRVSGGPNTENLLLVLGENQQVLAVVVATGSLNANSPITDLILVTAQNRGWMLDNIRMIWHFDDEIAWLGFVPIDDYLSAPKL